MSEIEIRHAVAADAPAIAGLSDELFQEDARQRDPTVNLDWAKQHGAAYFAEMIAGPDSGCFVAQAGGETVGYLAFRLHRPSDYRPIVSAELESILVRAPWRSQQIGDRLVQEFKRWARENNAQRLTVTAFAANERAILFYRRAGFAPHSLTLELREE
jgi:GNAT superfamily N-acetyltransferase